MRKFTDEERRHYLEAWKASGKSMKEFCRGEGIKDTTLHGWRVRFDGYKPNSGNSSKRYSDGFRESFVASARKAMGEGRTLQSLSHEAGIDPATGRRWMLGADDGCGLVKVSRDAGCPPREAAGSVAVRFHGAEMDVPVDLLPSVLAAVRKVSG